MHSVDCPFFSLSLSSSLCVRKPYWFQGSARFSCKEKYYMKRLYKTYWYTAARIFILLFIGSGLQILRRCFGSEQLSCKSVGRGREEATRGRKETGITSRRHGVKRAEQRLMDDPWCGPEEGKTGASSFDFFLPPYIRQKCFS